MMNKTSYFLLPGLILLLFSCSGGGSSSAEQRIPQPRTTVWEEVLSDPMKARGQDNLYDFSPKQSTPAPKGYEATYISHYGRHGSRFAYSAKVYSVILDMLQEALEEDNITPRGEILLGQLQKLWEEGRYQVGDLTPLGWKQHVEIARTMAESFPAAFVEGSKVDACSSPANRAMVSMTAFLTSLSRVAPKTEIYAHQSIMDTQATRPNLGPNPFRFKGPDIPFPYPESNEEFLMRKYPDCASSLGTLFKDPIAAIGERDTYKTLFYYYLLVCGTVSLPDDIHTDVDDLLTPEQAALLWEVFNLESFREYYAYLTSCSSVLQDMIEKADARLECGSRGADLRFGHDHVVLPLLMIMDLDGFGHFPSTVDELPLWFQNFRSVMGANIQMVFYTPKSGREGVTLVKFLVNGEEALLGNVPPASGPYYYWDEAREWMTSRIDSFVTEE